jgi:hypothetical protein
MIVFLVIIAADNIYRYCHWYPYGHFDGGQYGRSHIGLNKSCLVSFEAVPKFYEYYSELSEKGRDKYHIISVKGTDVKILNDYLIQMLENYFYYKGRKDVIFRSDLSNSSSDLIVSSPIFTPDTENLLKSNDYRKLKTITIANIAVANVWKGKQG